MSERYEAFAAVTKSRAMLSIGISAFQFLHPSSESSAPSDPVAEVPVIRKPKYTAETIDIEGWSEDEEDQPEKEPVIEWPFTVLSFNLLVKSTAESVLEPEAEAFLVDHGFDFERQQESGIPYTPSHACHPVDQDEPSDCRLRQLMHLLIRSRKAVVLHNGFLDLVFLYQGLYLNLPAKFGSFVTNLSQMFPSGVYDTKFVTDVIRQEKSSFLEYVYYKLQRTNVTAMMQGKTHVTVHFPDPLLSPEEVEHRDMKTRIWEEKPDDVQICEHYSRHGWCSESGQCDKSHNIDLILDYRRMRDEKKRKTSNKRLAKSIGHMVSVSKFNESLASEVVEQAVKPEVMREEEKIITEQEHESPLQVTGKIKSGAHRSGYDAFMTAYAFACLLTDYCRDPPFHKPLSHRTTGLKSFMNCVYLSGKDMPLKIRKGNFDKATPDHERLLSRIRENR